MTGLQFPADSSRENEVSRDERDCMAKFSSTGRFRVARELFLTTYPLKIRTELFRCDEPATAA